MAEYERRAADTLKDEIIAMLETHTPCKDSTIALDIPHIKVDEVNPRPAPIKDPYG